MATKKPEGKVKARVLLDCELGKCNDIVELDAKQLADVGNAVDTDPAAVAYAQSLKE